MNSYRFYNVDGVSISLICDVFDKILSDEMDRVGCFKCEDYRWHVGVDVIHRINDLERRNTLLIRTGPHKILGIDVIKSYDVAPNEIELRLKPGICKIDVSSMYPSFMVTSRGCGKSTMQLRYLNELMKMNKMTFNKPESIKNVIFNDPATIVFWSDGTKTVVKAEGEQFDPEKGLAMAISKKFLGNQGNYYEEFKRWLPEEESELKSVWSNESSLFSDITEKIRKARETIISNAKNNIEKEDEI